jgi:hypothetical protein
MTAIRRRGPGIDPIRSTRAGEDRGATQSDELNRALQARNFDKAVDLLERGAIPNRHSISAAHMACDGLLPAWRPDFKGMLDQLLPRLPATALGGSRLDYLDVLLPILRCMDVKEHMKRFDTIDRWASAYGVTQMVPVTVTAVLRHTIRAESRVASDRLTRQGP